MGVLEGAVSLLLEEYVEHVGGKYIDSINLVAGLKPDDPVHEVLREESDKLGRKLHKAKAYLQCLEQQKA